MTVADDWLFLLTVADDWLFLLTVSDLTCFCQQEEVSAENKVRFQQQVMEAQTQTEQNKAAHVLLKFFRSIIFKKHLKRLVFNCFQQIERELFSPFVITEKMCGVCGVSFEKASVPPKAPSSAEGEKATDEQQEEEEEEEEEEEVVVARLKQAHLTSDEHRVMDANFRSFREVYHNIIMQPLVEIGAFLSKYEVKWQWLPLALTQYVTGRY